MFAWQDIVGVLGSTATTVMSAVRAFTRFVGRFLLKHLDFTPYPILCLLAVLPVKKEMYQ